MNSVMSLPVQSIF